MDYTIRGQKRSIYFSTDLIVGVYGSESKSYRLDITRHEVATNTLFVVDYDSDMLHVLMIDSERLYIFINNDEAVNEIKEKLTEIGIEVREHEV